MISLISEGKNVEIAITNGLKELNVNREDVDIKIITTGGLFKKAKVEIVVDSEVEAQIVDHRKKLEALMEDEKEKVVEEESKIEKNASKTVKNEEKVEKTVNNPIVEMPQEEIKNTELNLEGGVKEGYDFLVTLLNKLEMEYTINVEPKADGVYFNIESEKVGTLIGKRGEGLNAVQYLVNIVAGKNDRNVERIFLNCGDYKERREQSLIMLARRIAVKVAKTGKRQELEPMNAYDRKIIHTALQNDKQITTYSIGEEPRRRLVIDIKKDEE